MREGFQRKTEKILQMVIHRLALRLCWVNYMFEVSHYHQHERENKFKLCWQIHYQCFSSILVGEFLFLQNLSSIPLCSPYHQSYALSLYNINKSRPLICYIFWQEDLMCLGFQNSGMQSQDKQNITLLGGIHVIFPATSFNSDYQIVYCCSLLFPLYEFFRPFSL